MVYVTLLEALKAETELAIGDMLLPVQMQKGDVEEPEPRAADVYLMALPDGSSATKKVPYVIHQFMTSSDEQQEGEDDKSYVTVRSVFTDYHEDGQERGLMLLNLMDRFRIHLLRKIVIGGGQFQLDKRLKLEGIVYPDDIAPFCAGEMVSRWIIPPVEREVRQYL